MKFSIGNLVVQKSEVKTSTSYNIYKVVSILDGYYIVEIYSHSLTIFEPDDQADYYAKTYKSPGTYYWQHALLRFQEEELFSLDEAKEELKRLENLKSEMENEFSKLRDQIKEKIDQAASIVKEVVEIAESHNKSLRDLTEESQSLYDLLQKSGWSNSSITC